MSQRDLSHQVRTLSDWNVVIGNDLQFYLSGVTSGSLQSTFLQNAINLRSLYLSEEVPPDLDSYIQDRIARGEDALVPEKHEALKIKAYGILSGTYITESGLMFRLENGRNSPDLDLGSWAVLNTIQSSPGHMHSDFLIQFC